LREASVLTAELEIVLVDALARYLVRRARSVAECILLKDLLQRLACARTYFTRRFKLCGASRQQARKSMNSIFRKFCAISRASRLDEEERYASSRT